MQCPNCGSQNVGKIGNKLFFCRDCYCEIKIKKHTVIINTYDQEGRIIFTVNPITQVVNKTITITDQSYDPNGDPIAEWQWRVQKPDVTWIYYGNTVPTIFLHLVSGHIQ